MAGEVALTPNPSPTGEGRRAITDQLNFPFPVFIRAEINFALIAKTRTLREGYAYKTG